MPRVLTKIALSVVLAVITFTYIIGRHTIIDAQLNHPIERKRKLSAISFSDTLATKSVCADLMNLAEIIEDYDGDSLQGALPDDYTVTTFFDDPPTGTQGTIVYSEEKRFIAAVFRGTEFFSLEDWKTNLNIDLVPANVPIIPSDVKLHKGFRNAVFGNGLFDLFEKELLKVIRNSSLDVEHVYLSGHSLVSIVATHILDLFTAGRNVILTFKTGLNQFCDMVLA